MQDDLRRILDLPVESLLEQEWVDKITQHLCQPGVYESGLFKLNVYQASALYDYSRYGGVFGPIGVGWGKTLLLLLIAQLYHEKTEGQGRSLYLLPPALVNQLQRTSLPWARSKVKLGYPITSFHGMALSRRAHTSRASHLRGLFIMPYSLLSAEDAEEVLNNISPGLVMADEAHMIARYTAARTKRLARYMDNGQDKEFVGVSGTMTSKSLVDYHHLLRWSLGNEMPLPHSRAKTEEWGGYLDAGAPNRGSIAGPMLPLHRWARNYIPENQLPDNTTGLRKAFSLRLATAPGVTATSDASAVGVSVLFRNLKPRTTEELRKIDGYTKLEELEQNLTDTWQAPDGTELSCSLQLYKWRYEFASGFYNQHIWPDVDHLVQRRSISAGQAEDYLDRSKQHFEARQEYNAALRIFLESPMAGPGIDTPRLVGMSMAKDEDAHVTPELYELWLAQKARMFPEIVERLKRPIRVCDFKVKQAVKFAKQGPGVIWYWHNEVGRWLMDVLGEAGIDPVHAHAGDVGGQRISDSRNHGRTVVASIGAHGTGKEMQAWDRMMFAQWPRPAKDMEQTVGRMHRQGQGSDLVEVVTCIETLFDQELQAATINDAAYVHFSIGNRQRLIYGDYETLPTIFSSELLDARGMSVLNLDDDTFRSLRERFL